MTILHDVLASDDVAQSIEEVVAKIQAFPPNPKNIRPAKGFLAEVLSEGLDDPTFDLAQWNREWAEVEREMCMMTVADDSAEGHRS